MNTYRFVHLSDIHFGQEKGGDLVIHEDVRDELLRDCDILSEPNAIGPANGVLITGDIAYSGKQKEYEQAGEWLDQLTEIVGCSEIAINVIPGNHDINLDKISYVARKMHDELRSVPLDQLDNVLADIVAEDDESNPLLPKFADYREFASRYGCDFLSGSKPIWRKRHNLNGHNILEFFGLNSVQVSNKQDESGNMVLGNNQYVIPRRDNLEYVVMVHHPVSWYRDHSSAAQYLNRAKVLMVGHQHSLDIRKLPGDNGSERLEIYAGATNPPMVNDFYPYRYNWIEFYLQSETEGNNLVVKIHPRVWEPSETKFVSDKARLNGEESKEFSLSCLNFKTSQACQSVGVISETPMERENCLDQGDSLMTKEGSDHFARLRYFFWKYLDWDKRLKVLVKLDIIPSTPNQPVPQTMERLALDAARDQGKLYNLWSAIMEIVPKDKREANPFTKERS